MPQTEAQKRAKAKYDAKHYGMITAKADKDIIMELKAHAGKNGISASKFALKAMLYCKENNIDLGEEK